MVESDQRGRQLVEENGLLPGVELHADYAANEWHIGLVGEIYKGDLAYDGQTQNRAAFSTYTKTGQYRIRAEAARKINDVTLLILGIERDYWRRTIQGRGATLGMDERYSSWRLLTGLQRHILRPTWKSIYVKGMLIASGPETLVVRFDNQLFDKAKLTTKPALGARVTVGAQAISNSDVKLELDFEWMRIDRSDNGVIYKNGIPAGLLAQPEHVRKSFGIKVNFPF